MFRAKDGRIRDRWAVRDHLPMMIGAASELPGPGPWSYSASLAMAWAHRKYLFVPRSRTVLMLNAAWRCSASPA
jgi:hypothetical protein